MYCSSVFVLLVELCCQFEYAIIIYFLVWFIENVLGELLKRRIVTSAIKIEALSVKRPRFKIHWKIRAVALKKLVWPLTFRKAIYENELQPIDREQNKSWEYCWTVNILCALFWYFRSICFRLLKIERLVFPSIAFLALRIQGNIVCSRIWMSRYINVKWGLWNEILC